MTIELRRVAMPALDVPAERPEIPVAEYEARARALYEAASADWVAIYGDREHNANLLFVAGFDPRFEEAMMMLGPEDARILIVGNEGLGHATECRLPVDVVLYQPFSLMGQPRGTSAPLDDLLRDLQVNEGQSIGVVGWKYLGEGDVEHPEIPSYVPAFLVHAFERVTATTPKDGTAALMDPVRGLRNHNSAAQIAQFEFGASRASAAVFRILGATKPGISEFDAVSAMEYAGDPLAAHLMFTTSEGQINGLLSPTSRQISKGDGVTTGVAFWGGLCCRAGVVTDEPDEEFTADYVKPYYSAIATWWQTIGLDVTGGEVHDRVMDALEDAVFKPALNPGHQVSFDEWVHSPVRPGSEERFFSGMMLQCDIIPTPLPDSRGLNCEDTVAIADESLRREIVETYPDLWQRVTARRKFMETQLGLRLKPEVLPLSVAPAYLPPFWMDSELVCTVAEAG